MVAGHLSEKNGHYYVVLSYTDNLGRRKTKWISTGLTVKGNKKKAQQILAEKRRLFMAEEEKIRREESDILFADFLEDWLGIIKTSIAPSTYSSYCTMIRKIIAPYFRRKDISLKELTAKDIQKFYLEELKRVSASTVIRYHANIHKALKYAVKLDLIEVNPADKVERPKKERFTAEFYSAEEIKQLINAADGTRLEIPILLGSVYGLRRSEILGLKWEAINFDKNTITVKHTVTSCEIDGKRVLIQADTTKTKSSMRTLPLLPFVKEKLLLLRDRVKENRQLCGNCYNSKFKSYICVNEVGDLMKPNYISASFKKLLAQNGLRIIRFHDLRHSCASLLLANGVPMKNIQEWLGHSDFATTANIYAHLDYKSKLDSADAMISALSIE